MQESDQSDLLDIMNSYYWVGLQIKESTYSTARLRALFGRKSEKKAAPDKSSLSSSKNKKPKKKKGHGRKKSEDYTAAKDIECKREDLTHGAACPDDECDGSVYRQSDPGNIIRITGGSLVSATRYKLERYRCNLCKPIFSASRPKDDSSSEKYDTKAKAVVTLDRIQMPPRRGRQ